VTNLPLYKEMFKEVIRKKLYSLLNGGGVSAHLLPGERAMGL
jgi:hypothetical protein